MTIAQQLKQIEDAQNVWAKEYKGKAEIATDIVHFLSLLSLAPGSVRSAILFNGELPRGDIEELGRVDRSFLIAISRGRSLTLDQAGGLVNKSGSGEPLFNLVEFSRDSLLAMKFDPDTCERMPYYKGIRRVEVEGFLIDAYQIEIQIGTQIPVPIEEEDEDPEFPV
jgi:hypothetical protein